jgi:hypothetical protein
MNKYLVYITAGGLMEDPVQRDEDHTIIEAEDGDKAVETFLRNKGLRDERYINRGQNGFGWSYYFPITCIDITESLLKHKEARDKYWEEQR